jgi:hypothetical protein
MAYADLTPEQKAELGQWLRDYRAAMADTVRGMRKQYLLKMAYDNSISAIWAQVGTNDVIPDESGLAGADKTMTKGDFNPKLTWSSNLVNGVYSDAGGAVATVWPDRETVDSYGVQLAGPNNI